MSVWLAIPSKRPADEAEKCLKEWRERGYKIALWCDSEDEGKSRDLLGDKVIWPSDAGYPGYAQAVNWLCNLILDDPSAEWIVAAGDDTLPDPNHSAEEIAKSCFDYFGGTEHGEYQGRHVATFGVMQPTGDPWADSQGRIIERIAGSPWIGREFARRMYGGAGPYWHEFTHMFVDEHLQCVAQKLGVFWQRPDLIHHHNNWGRPKPGGPPFGDACNMPDFLKQWNTTEHWNKSKAIFERLKAGGFAEADNLLP